MKQLLQIATFLVVGMLNAQTVEEESKKLDELISIAKSKNESTEKATAVVDIMLFGAKAKNPETSKKANEAVAEINNYAAIDKIAKDNNVVLSKPLSDLSKDDLKSFKWKEDKFKDITFIHHKRESGDFLPYLSIKNETLNMRIQASYSGKNWIFFDKVILLTNGNKYEFNVSEPDRKVGSGYVGEYGDDWASPELIDFLRKAVNSDYEIEMRFTGKYSDDQKMSKNEKLVLKETIDLYDKLKK